MDFKDYIALLKVDGKEIVYMYNKCGFHHNNTLPDNSICYYKESFPPHKEEAYWFPICKDCKSRIRNPIPIYHVSGEKFIMLEYE